MLCLCVKRLTLIRERALIAVTKPMFTAILLVFNKSFNQQPFTVTQSVSCLSQMQHFHVMEENVSSFYIKQKDTKWNCGRHHQNSKSMTIFWVSSHRKKKLCLFFWHGCHASDQLVQTAHAGCWLVDCQEAEELYLTWVLSFTRTDEALLETYAYWQAQNLCTEGQFPFYRKKAAVVQ